MVGKILVGTAVWLISNKTGQKVAKKGFKILSKLGDYAVNGMPDNIATMFNSTEKLMKDFIQEDNAPISAKIENS